MKFLNNLKTAEKQWVCNYFVGTWKGPS